jgi:cytochrome c'
MHANSFCCSSLNFVSLPVAIALGMVISFRSFAVGDRVDQLIAAVQAAAVQLVPAVKSGDKEAIAAAYTAVGNACNACHTDFRKEE